MKKLIIILTISIFSINLLSNDEININFKDIKINDLIKITSKITNKNILVTQSINEKIDFVPTQKITKDNLFQILEEVLKDKGYFLVDENNILKVKKVEIPKVEVEFTEIITLKNIDGTNTLKILDEMINKKYTNKENKPFISFRCRIKLFSNYCN